MPNSSFSETFGFRWVEGLAWRFSDEQRPQAMALFVVFSLTGWGALADAAFGVVEHDPWLRTFLTCGVTLMSWMTAWLCVRSGNLSLPVRLLAIMVTVNFIGQYQLTGDKYFLCYFTGVPLSIALLGGAKMGGRWLLICIAAIWGSVFYYETQVEPELLFSDSSVIRECVPISVATAALLAIGYYSEHLSQKLAAQRQETVNILESERLRLQALMQSSYQGIVECSNDGVVLTGSRGLEDVIGWTGEELAGRPLVDLIHFDSRHRVRHYFGGSSGDELEQATQELRLQHQHGDVVWAQVSGNSYYDALGNERVVLAIRSIEEQKARERKFLEGQKLQGLAAFAGGVAHDFNNLLTAIAAYSELVTDEAAREGIQRATTRAARLTRKILAFGRKQEVRHQVVSVNQVISDTSATIQSLAREDIQVDFQLTNEVDTVLADPDQIQQVFLNLVTNARDAMPHGGAMHVMTFRQRLTVPEARRLGIAAGDYILASVEDSGEGMEKQTIERAFEPFFTTKQNGVGSGLGLAGVHGIAHQNQGAVKISSEPSVGTRVDVYLPFFRGQATVDPIEWPSSNGATREFPTVPLLLVEDEVVLRRVLSKALEQSGFSVLQASNGVEATEVLKANGETVQVMVTDIVMPEMRGNDLAQIVRQEFPDIRILLTSGYHDAQLNLPHDDPQIGFLPKPFTPGQLVDAVRRLQNIPLTL